MNENIFLLFFVLCPAFVFAVEKIDINSSSLEELDNIVGIGPVLAQRITDARPFYSVDDLIRVKGIGEKTLQKIKDQGLAYVKGETVVVEPTEAINGQTKEASLAVYPAGIVINEILPSPEGPDEKNEWIELYNQNNFEIDLSGWKIEDIQGTKTTYTFDKNAKIAPYGFLVLERPETKITLNNSADGLNLLWPDDKIVDSVNYTKSPINQSYNKIGSNFSWSLSLTPGTKNIIATAETKNNKQGLPNSQKSGNSNKVEAGLAAVNESINQEKIKSSNPWLLFFTAVIITIISALLVLFIKFKLNNHVGT